ncbi:MAG: lipopolysaccharide biosynthesis protein, partial [Geminicoccaceae bacterium]
ARAGSSNLTYKTCDRTEHEFMFQKIDIKRGILWRLVEVVGAEFFAFCSFLVLTWLLAPEHFGVVALATMFIMVAQLVLYQGIGEALVQKEGIDEAFFSSALWMNTALAALAAAVLTSTSSWIADVFSEPGFAPILRAIAPLLLIYAVSGILQAKLRRDLKLKAFAFASIAATLCGALVAIVMALMDFEAWSLVGRQWVYALISTAMFLTFAAWWPRLSMLWSHFLVLAGFSSNVIGSALLRFGLRQVDLLFLGFHLPAREVGLYFLATRLLNTVGQVTYQSIQKIGLPVLSRLQTDPEKHRAGVISILRLTCMICLPIFLGMVTTADLFIPIMFDAAWNGAIAPFRMQCLFSIFFALSLIANQVLLSAGLAGTVLRLSMINVALFIISVALASPHGITATAAAGGLANMLCLPIYLQTLRQKLDLDLTHLLSELWPTWLAAAVMTTTVLTCRHTALTGFHGGTELTLSILIGTTTYTAVIATLHRWYDHLSGVTTSLGSRS